jgi:hypothetical protein
MFNYNIYLAMGPKPANTSSASTTGNSKGSQKAAQGSSFKALDDFLEKSSAQPSDLLNAQTAAQLEA